MANTVFFSKKFGNFLYLLIHLITPLPPRSNVDVMKDFELLVQRIKSLGLEVNILGDLNCNVAACPLELRTKNLLEIYNLYQYQQLINEHTRITEKCATIIDLFLTNNKEVLRILGSVTSE